MVERMSDFPCRLTVGQNHAHFEFNCEFMSECGVSLGEGNEDKCSKNIQKG